VIIAVLVAAVGLLLPSHSAADARPSAIGSAVSSSTAPDLSAGSWVGMPGLGTWSD
jgi:hypothetical protein